MGFLASLGMTSINKPKLIVILGPTATGKTKLAVSLAKKFNGEIVSADSRQVYQGMDIGTGKDLKEYGKIKYHLIDIVKPNTEFNLAKYKNQAIKIIQDILKRGKVPFLVGGTGLYISSLVENYDIPKVKPNKLVRKKLEKLNKSEKIKMLKKLDKKSLEFVDVNNPRRLDRALEICLSGQKFSEIRKKNESLFDILQIGLTFPREILNKRINERIDKRLKQGMINEVKKLHKQGVSWKRLEDFGLEYKFIAQYLQNKLEKDEMIDKLKTAIHQFAKRQMTWFSRQESQSPLSKNIKTSRQKDKRIKWIKNKSEAKKIVKNFLSL